jgi:hypothetical protein
MVVRQTSGEGQEAGLHGSLLQKSWPLMKQLPVCGSQKSW